MTDLHLRDPDFIRKTQNLKIGDRVLVRSDTPPEWIDAMNKYKGKWLTVFNRVGEGSFTTYTDVENHYSAFYPTDMEQVVLLPPALCVKSPNLPSV